MESGKGITSLSRLLPLAIILFYPPSTAAAAYYDDMLFALLLALIVQNGVLFLLVAVDRFQLFVRSLLNR